MLAFDTARPLRQADFPDLVEAVVNATPSDESDWLEWKSTLDLSSKAAHSHIARAVLGFANRLPDDAAGFAGGCGYLLVGVEPGRVVGVAQVDPVELDRGVCAYTGTTDGPRWRSFYHTDASGKSVLIVEVAAPVWGDPVFTARKEGDRITDGLVLVRRPGGNRQATSAEHALLVQRAARRVTTLSVAASAPETAAVALTDIGPDAQERWLSTQRRAALRSLEQHRATKDPDLPIVLSSRSLGPGDAGQGVGGVAAGGGAVAKWISENQRALQAAAGVLAAAFETVPEKRTEQEYEREVDAYVGSAREALSSVLLAAAGKAVLPIRLCLHNPGHNTLKAVLVTAVVRGAWVVLPGRGYARHELPAPPRPFGPQRKRLDTLSDRNYLLPYIADHGYPALATLPPRRERPDIQDRGDGTVTVEFPPIELRATAGVPLDELVLFAVAPRSEPVTVQWSATSSNVDGIARGSLTMPVDQAPVPLEHLLDAGRE